MKQQSSNPEPPESQKSLVQKRFGRQASAYSTSSILSNQENLNDIIQLAGISATDSILDVATGTGFLAAAFCDAGARVLATDLTAPMLEQARLKVEHRDNAAFALADVERLPFSETTFDVISCRVAFHHFPHPLVALKEMARVCKLGGRVVIMDVISEENAAKSKYQNRMEVLRDPSHIKHYSQSEFEQMMGECGLAVDKIRLWQFTWFFDEWMRIAGASAADVQKARTLMLDSIDGDKAGLRPELRDGELFFTYTTIIIVARK